MKADWCRRNGVYLKTYYYRLKRVKQAIYRNIEQHDIVTIIPEKESEISFEKIKINVGSVKITLPDTLLIWGAFKTICCQYLIRLAIQRKCRFLV